MKIFSKKKLILFFCFSFLSSSAHDMNISFGRSWLYVWPYVVCNNFFGLISYYTQCVLSGLASKEIKDALKEMEEAKENLKKIKQNQLDFHIENQKKGEMIAKERKELAALVDMIVSYCVENTTQNDAVVKNIMTQLQEYEKELELFKRQINVDFDSVTQQDAKNREKFEEIKAAIGRENNRLIQLQQTQQARNTIIIAALRRLSPQGALMMNES